MTQGKAHVVIVEDNPYDAEITADGTQKAECHPLHRDLDRRGPGPRLYLQCLRRVTIRKPGRT